MDPFVFLFLLAGLTGAVAQNETTTMPPVNTTNLDTNVTGCPFDCSLTKCNLPISQRNLSTVTTTTTPSPTPPPTPTINLGFKIEQTFTAQLANQSSPEFKELENTVTKELDKVYTEKYGPNFNRTVIRGFSKGSVVVDAELIFNNVTTLPNSSSVTETLQTAASSSNFSLSVNASSITAAVVVPPAPTTAQPSTLDTTASTVTTTTTPSPTQPPLPTVNLGFKIQETFRPQLANQSSPEFKQLENNVTRELDKVYREKYGPNFNRTVIRGFSEGSVVVDAELIFNNVTTLPNSSSVIETLQTAASSSNFSLSVNASSITAAVVVPPAPTTAQPSTLDTTASTVNSTTPPVNATTPPVNGTTPPVNATTPPVNGTTPTVNATTQPVNSTTPPVNGTTPPINGTTPPVNATTPPVNGTTPPVNATTHPVNGTTPPVNATTPTVNGTTPPVNATTPPVNGTTPPVNATTPPVNGTTPPVNATTPPVSPPVNATTPPVNATSQPVNQSSTIPPGTPSVNTTSVLPTITIPTPQQQIINLGFRLNDEFKPAFSNKSSPDFIQLRTTVSRALDNVYSRRYGPIFNRSEVNNFSPGSIVVQADLIFNNETTLPNTSSVIEALQTAPSTANFTLNLNTSSITATTPTETTVAPSTLNTTTSSVNSTTPPVNATTPPVNGTTPPVNATTPPVNGTTPTVNATTQPVNSTTPPVNGTTPPINGTTPPVNATTPPVNGTTPPVNATTHPVNGTTPPVNATTPTVNGTTPPVNATTPPVNGTTPPVNATTPPVSPPVNATTPPVNATSQPVNQSSTIPPVNTTSVLPTITIPTPQQQIINLGFRLNDEFKPAFSNKSSPDFIQLRTNVSRALDNVYSRKYGHIFIRSEVNNFSPGSIVVQADLIFNNETTLPNTSSVIEALQTAPSTANFTLNLNTSSITATILSAPTETTVAPSTLNTTTSSAGVNTTSTPVSNTTSAPVSNTTSTPVSNTTSAPVSNTTSTPVSNTTSAPVSNTTSTPVSNTTSAPVSNTTSTPVSNTTSAPVSNTTSTPVSNTTSTPVSSTTSSTTTVSTAVTTTTTTTTTASTSGPTSSEGSLGLTFSLNQDFTPDLAVNTSQAFLDLASKVVNQINIIGTKLYGPIYRRSRVRLFQSGSVITLMDLVFLNKNSVPSISNATAGFSRELSSSSLNVMPGSVSAQASSSSRLQPPMFSLVVFSLTLLAMVQMLMD
ncbi:hypothetical protein Q5P01_025251 [Channa striata]|uniref:SEA domain-containing protein n=1 Tax=Channa striata TaxID=64152 RepID=A0AA88IM12_CHASR|nr:hypothetical protein Q5P01_025251 [Channa striata]